MKEKNGTMTVDRDRTGSYLRFENEDYQIYNTEAVANFTNGASVTATFEKIRSCSASKHEAVC